MTSMKRSPSEVKEGAVPTDIQEEYPWGLRISLDEETLTKLGITMLEVGSEVRLSAIASVTDCRMSDSEEFGKRRSCSLQITDLTIPTKPSADDIAQRMYGE